MKKKKLFIFLGLAVVLAVGAFFYIRYKTANPKEPHVNFDALYQAMDAEETVCTVNGREISWDEYYNEYSNNIHQFEYNFVQMQTYYGIKLTWDDATSVEGYNYATLAQKYTEDTLIHQGALMKYASDKGASYDPAKQNPTTELFNQIYGSHGEKLPADDARTWMDNQGYLHLMQILLFIEDPETGEKLSDEQLSEKALLAEETIAEIKAIESNEERVSRFSELVAQINEDPGMAEMTEGYTVLKSNVYTQICDAVAKIEDYGVTEVISTERGYNIIMRLPNNPDEIPFEYQAQEDQKSTGRLLCAYDLFNKEADEYIKNTEIEYLEGIIIPDVREYLVR